MRKLKLQVQMSLDGFVAGPNGELDWIWIGKGDEFLFRKIIDLADSCDTILLGRKMTAGFVEYWVPIAIGSSRQPARKPGAALGTTNGKFAQDCI